MYMYNYGSTHTGTCLLLGGLISLMYTMILYTAQLSFIGIARALTRNVLSANCDQGFVNSYLLVCNNTNQSIDQNNSSERKPNLSKEHVRVCCGRISDHYC